MAQGVDPAIRHQLMMADMLRRFQEGGVGYNKGIMGPEALKYLQKQAQPNTSPLGDRGQTAVDIYNRNK